MIARGSVESFRREIMRQNITGGLAFVGVLTVIAACLEPVWHDWSGSVVAPFGGIDAMLQLGILEWTARHWIDPATWVDLPIFFPVPGALGFMDSLLGQAWLVAPLRMFLDPTAAGLYNWAFLGSLLTAALAAVIFWRVTGGPFWTAGVFALALVGAPYTQAQLGHLNQLPPPFVLVALAAVAAAMRGGEEGSPTTWTWWVLGGALVIQAAWGWYGFAHALVGVAVLKICGMWFGLRRGEGWSGQVGPGFRAAWLPVVLTGVAVVLLALPQLQLAARYPEFTRQSEEVRLGSADIQHFLNRGVYRGEPTDWIGQGTTGLARYQDRHRQVLNPGWVALTLALIGWFGRSTISSPRRRQGTAFLIMGLVGVVLAFGDSVGLPGTDKRLALPLEWLRNVIPPFKAFRGAWRFSWLFVIAVAWWSAVGVEVIVRRKGLIGRLTPATVALLVLVSLPAAVPSLEVPLTGRPLWPAFPQTGAVVTLPAPPTEYKEDVTEALWIARVLETGQPVTGGATGWVPPEIVDFRIRLEECEMGNRDPAQLFADWKEMGIVSAEIALRPGDERRTDFWRRTLLDAGAVRREPWPRPGYEMYRLP
jgi:hypothetical protein